MTNETITTYQVTHEQVKRWQQALRVAISASICTCGIDTLAYTHHKPDCSYRIRQGAIVELDLLTPTAQEATVNEELIAAMETVLRISDRKHDAWDAAKAGIAAARAAQAPPPPSAKRAALLARLQSAHALHAKVNAMNGSTRNGTLFGEAYDMLAADARGAVIKTAQQVAVPQGFGELIRIAAWLLSPEPTRSIDALEENTHIGHRQFSAAQEAMREVLRLKAIAIKEEADKLAAAPQPPQVERVPMPPQSNLNDPRLTTILFSVLVKRLGGTVTVTQDDIDAVAYNRLEEEGREDGTIVFRFLERGRSS